ncbi:hypothetical protein [Prevotella sp. oral taxon 376]|uniref:hypothetical protein n=1 Tax=Prevotella sp. oral taxon 376 TaxID=712466 RepID=UPI0018EEA87D|nr:hypothetical protein [Prevotella sp. oral taxon 376]
MKTTNADIKRYKEQVMTRTKKDESEDLERFGRFIRLTAHQLVSAKPTEKECASRYKSGQIGQIIIF